MTLILMPAIALTVAGLGLTVSVSVHRKRAEPFMVLIAMLVGVLSMAAGVHIIFETILGAT